MRAVRRGVAAERAAFSKTPSMVSEVYGAWDAEAAAGRAYKVHRDALVDVAQGTDARLRGLMLRAAAVVALSTGLTAPTYLYLLFAPCWSELVTGGVVTTAALASTIHLSNRISQTAISMRIVPSVTGTPIGAKIEIITQPYIFYTTRSTRLYALENISRIGISDDGLWRILEFTSPGGRKDMYQLRLCNNVSSVMPFLVSMKRHLEDILLEEGERTTILKMQGTERMLFDLVKLAHVFAPAKSYTDVGPTNPFPRKVELKGEGEGDKIEGKDEAEKMEEKK